MSMPNTYTNNNETGCCPIPNIKDWDEKKVVFENKKFVRSYTKSFMHIPLNMGSIMTKLYNLVQKNNANLPIEQAMILSRDVSAWKAEQLYAVSKIIDGVDNIELSGTFLTKVFEGPFQDGEKWYNQSVEYAKKEGFDAREVYFFYTTCPKCAKHYGKNFVITLTKV